MLIGGSGLDPKQDLWISQERPLKSVPQLSDFNLIKKKGGREWGGGFNPIRDILALLNFLFSLVSAC